MAGRASPAVRADEDVHNPSVDGLRYEAGALVLQRSDTVAPKRSTNGDVLADGLGTVSVDGDVYLTVLRRSYVRTRTSTTPVLMGSVRGGSVGASTAGDRRS